MGIIAVGEGADEFVGAGELAGVDELLIGGVGVAPAEVLLDGAGEEDVLLQHHGHRVPEGADVVVPNVHAAHLHAALGDVVEPGDELDQGGFAGAGAAQDAHGHAGPDVQAHMVQGVAAGFLGIAEGHVFKVNGAVLHFGDGGLGIVQSGLLSQNLAGPAKGRSGHGQHDHHHGYHHQRV